MDWLLYDMDLRHERVNNRRFDSRKVTLKWNKIVYVFSTALMLELFLVPFSVLRLNTEIYRIIVRVHSKYGKIRAERKSEFEQFSRSELSRIYFSKNFQSVHKNWSFPLRIFPVNVTKSAGNGGFGHIYWTNLQCKSSFVVPCILFTNIQEFIW